jgi:hypothetical protein
MPKKKGGKKQCGGGGGGSGGGGGGGGGGGRNHGGGGDDIQLAEALEAKLAIQHRIKQTNVSSVFTAGGNVSTKLSDALSCSVCM